MIFIGIAITIFTAALGLWLLIKKPFKQTRSIGFSYLILSLISFIFLFINISISKWVFLLIGAVSIILGWLLLLKILKQISSTNP
jgi:hypothetical protein